jgi:hypothetical protein
VCVVAQAMQQQQDGLPAAAVLDPQASLHTPQSATTHARTGPPCGPGKRILQPDGTTGASGRPALRVGHCLLHRER